MKTYSADYLSEFEQEFDSNEFEFENDSESDSFNEFENDEFEIGDSEFEFENDSESDSFNEFENDEFEIGDSEFEYEDEIDNRDRYFENRLYELFTNKYDSEFEFESGFNEIMHEMERDYFWKKLKKFGAKALKTIAPIAEKALRTIPGGAKYVDLAKSLTTNPRNFLRTAVKTLGPMALNAVAPGAGSVLGAVLNNEIPVPSGQARQAAKDTVALAKKTYTNFANNMAKLPPSSNPAQLQQHLTAAAKNAIQTARGTVMPKNGNKHRLLSRKIQKVQGYKVVTSIYKI